MLKQETSMVVALELELTSGDVSKWPLPTKEEVCELLRKVLYEEDLNALETLHSFATGCSISAGSKS